MRFSELCIPPSATDSSLIKDIECRDNNCCLDLPAQSLFSQSAFTFPFAPAALPSLPATLENGS